MVIKNIKSVIDTLQIDSSIKKPPINMVFVPAGFTNIGSKEGLPQEKPTFWIYVKPFFMDENLVTVSQFRIFVKATNYKTDAEKFGNGGVFNIDNKSWELKSEANWENPQGTDHLKAPDNHPVTQVSWYDANAFAKWAGKELPNEFEWEHAARNAKNDQNLYPWGNDLEVNGKAMANTWNGIFPEKNANTDGFLNTSPVGFFGKTPLGLNDMTGNVWEWCKNHKMNYQDILDCKIININKSNPKRDTIERAQRGGSFLCEPTWCHGYRVSGRSGSSPETSLMHVGFRCMKSLK